MTRKQYFAMRSKQNKADPIDRLEHGLKLLGKAENFFRGKPAPVANHVVIQQGPDGDILAGISDGPHFILAIQYNQDGSEKGRKVVRQNNEPDEAEARFAKDLVYNPNCQG